MNATQKCLDHVSGGNGRSWLACCLLGLMALGCRTPHVNSCLHPTQPEIIVRDLAKEKCKAVLPPYRIEPPDVLMIDAVNVVPKSPYRLRTLDSVFINVDNALPDVPLSGVYPIGMGGIVDLGPVYGSVQIAGMTVEEAAVAIDKKLLTILKEPKAYVSIAEIAGKQQISGEHLVGPDGTVNLGTYGDVSVVGLTTREAKAAIELHLSVTLEDPEVAVSVAGYNSQVYYVITQGAGLGDSSVRFPVTGNETVLDAISQVNGTTSASSKHIWVARPGTNADGQDQILPVDWVAITERARVDTNYQLMPGDRVFIAEDNLVAIDTKLGKMLAPVERAFGFTLLGTNMTSRIRFFNQGLVGQGGF